MDNKLEKPDSVRGEIPESMARYDRQIRFSGMGVEGQQRLADSRAVVIGCGALGGVSANLLARAGVGELKLVDRDFVELNNLQRQVLFDESDVGIPKAIAAADKLKKINSSIGIEHLITDVDFRNIEPILLRPRRADIVIDGSDNFDVRFLINDACIKNSIPWIYAGCLGAEGQVMTILPGESACLNCLMTEGPPPPGTTATCDTGGILASIVNVAAAIQVNEALKILSGQQHCVNPKLMVFDLWGNRNHAINISNLREKADCRTCVHGNYAWLSGVRGSQSIVLCGRNAVQVSFPDKEELILDQLATRWAPLGTVESNAWLVRLKVDGYLITAFRDGRAIISGTDDIAHAKKLYAQYIGA